jgi:hypothetical protein
MHMGTIDMFGYEFPCDTSKHIDMLYFLSKSFDMIVFWYPNTHMHIQYNANIRAMQKIYV